MTYLRKILALVLLLTGVLAFSSCYTLKFNPNNDAIRILVICKGDNLSLNEAVNESDALKITEILIESICIKTIPLVASQRSKQL